MSDVELTQRDHEAAHALKQARAYEDNAADEMVSVRCANSALAHLAKLIATNAEHSPTWLLEKLQAMVSL